MDDDMKSLRKKSPRHVLVLEAYMDEKSKRSIFGMADRLRLAVRSRRGASSAWRTVSALPATSLQH